MPEGPVAFVTRRALPRIFVTELNRMLEGLGHRLKCPAAERLLDGRMTDRTIVTYHSAVIAEMLTVVTSETALCIEVADVVDMGPPVGFHLGKEVRLI